MPHLFLMIGRAGYGATTEGLVCNSTQIIELASILQCPLVAIQL